MIEIDFSKPIEAVNEDGSVMSAYIEDPQRLPDDPTVGAKRVDGGYMHCNADGTRVNKYRYDTWTLRNVVPSLVAPELVEKMRKLVDSVLEDRPDCTDSTKLAGLRMEARAIVFALDPVDDDLAEAREIVALVLNSVESGTNAECCIRGQWDNEESVQRIYAALAHGRQLKKDKSA